MRIIGMLATVVMALLIVMFALFAWQAASRISVSPQAITDAAREAVIITLASGKPDQKVQTIVALEKLGTDAKPFVPALVSAAHDENVAIRAAALHALGNIDPQAAKDSVRQ